MATDCTTDTLSTAKERQSFRRNLLAWFEKHKRDLPWRRTRDPYQIWLSEIMLQQTTVAMAGPKFTAFVAAFPTVHGLAAADEQQVLRMWEGLGYYRRARGLHAAAKVIVGEHDGQLPRDVPTLMKLPGVGRYTAGAVASFAYDVSAPIVETNTQRVLARLTGYRGEVVSSEGQRHIWNAAESLLPATGAGKYNLALMELGALVCKPSEPRCDLCSVTVHCAAFAAGLQREIPKLAAKVKVTAIREATVVVRKSGRVLLRQRAKGERWEGMWDFPRFPLDGEGPLFVRRELVDKVREQTGVEIEPGALLKTIKHGVTRYRITLDCYEARAVGGRIRSTDASPVRWTPLTELADLPLSVTARKIATLIGRQG
jgi:A/G-specific adenine glycosylase